jgi:hypothetical protein
MTRFPRSRQGALLLALALVAAWTPLPGAAQTDASALSALSALPLASLVASEAGAAASQASTPVLVAGAELVVKAVASTATGTVYLLERVSDGVQVSVEVVAKAAASVALSVGTAVVVSAIAAGLVLSAAGQAVAFIPNEVGRALLYNQRLGG